MLTPPPLPPPHTHICTLILTFICFFTCGSEQSFSNSRGNKIVVIKIQLFFYNHRQLFPPCCTLCIFPNDPIPGGSSMNQPDSLIEATSTQIGPPPFPQTGRARRKRRRVGRMLRPKRAPDKGRRRRLRWRLLLSHHMCFGIAERCTRTCPM